MANDFNISLLAGLDVSKSKEQIDKDINTIKSNIGKLEIEAKISPDTAKNITSQLNNLQIGLKDITIDKATLDGLVNQINSALKGIKIGNINVNVGNQAQSVGQKIGQQISNGVTQAVSNAVATSKKSFDELWNVMRDGKPLTAILDKDGLDVAVKVVKDLEGINICTLTSKDVVRHPLVQKIVKAYEDYEKKSSRPRENRRKKG